MKTFLWMIAAAVCVVGCGQQESPQVARETPLQIHVEKSSPATPSAGMNDVLTADTPASRADAAASSQPVVIPPSVEKPQSSLRSHAKTAMLTAQYEAPAALLAGQKTATAPASQKPTSAPLIHVESREIGKGNTLSGLDVLERDGFKQLKGKRVALLTNHSAINREGRHILDLLIEQGDVNLVKLFSPEHGLYGDVDTKVSDFKDTATGLMVHSLYADRKGEKVKAHYPRLSDLDGLDLVVVDMQDIGAVFYTYCSYMGYMMEECAKKGVEVMVLDRPNPIGGVYVDGPPPDEDFEGNATGYFRMPTAHGMTMAELAKMFNAEKQINCKLSIVPCENLTRDMYFDQTGLRWVNPSPNIQDLEAAIVYPGIGITEAIVSMGRGTPEPFHVFGASYIDNPQEMIDHVTSGGLAGIRLEAVDFTPTGTLARAHAGDQLLCQGARMHITDRKTFRAYELGLRVITYLQEKYGRTYVTERKYDWGKKKWITTERTVPQYSTVRIRGPLTAIVACRVQEGKPLKETLAYVDKEVAKFKPIREKYLIYK